MPPPRPPAPDSWLAEGSLAEGSLGESTLAEGTPIEERLTEGTPVGPTPDQATPDRATPGKGAPAERWVVMGRLGSPFGVQGWLRVQTYSADPETLLDFGRWWVRSVERVSMVREVARVDAAPRSQQVQATDASGWREVEVLEAQAHGGGLIARLEGIDDRDQALRARGTEVGVLRSELPEPDADEFYWDDLIGLDAIDPEGRKLGVVTGLLEAGAHDVLVIDTPATTRGGKVRQLLVPFVERHVGAVDLRLRRVVVDWQEPV